MEPTFQQSSAIFSPEKRIVIRACPGSGKTTVIAARVEWMINNGVDPSNIAVVNYTNAAANVVRSRLQDKMIVGLAHCGTLHSLMFRLVRQEHESRKYVQPTIITEAGRLLMFSTIRHAMGLNKVPMSQIEAAYDLMAGLPGISSRPGPAETIVAAYNRRLVEEGLYDYDSLLRIGKTLFQRCHADTGKIVRQIKHLFVDEFQDAGTDDIDIYNGWPTETVTMVGDPNQTIYGFRNAATENIFKQGKRSGWKELTLSINFRSRERIIRAADALISNNPDHGTLMSRIIPPAPAADSATPQSADYARSSADNGGASLAQAGAGTFDSHTVESPEAARQLVAKLIRERREFRPEQIAVLCRTNHSVAQYRQTLVGEGMTVAVEQKDAMVAKQILKAFLSFIQRPSPLTTAILSNVTQDEKLSLCKNPLMDYGIPDGAWNIHLGSLVKIAQSLGVTSPGIDWMLDHGLMLPGQALSMLRDEPGEDECSKGITVTTAHASKGKEFDYVIIVDLCEGLWPLSKAGGVEEERRLAYVAMTRARIGVTLISHLRSVMPWGQHTATKPSRFVAEAMPS